MAVSQILLLFSVTVIIFPNFNKGRYLAVKCCPRGKELDSNLTDCRPATNINNTSEPVGGSFHTTEVAALDFDARNTSTNSSSSEAETSFDVMDWLPEHLQTAMDPENPVLLGGRRECGDGRTVRLESPRDDNRFQWLRNGSLALRSRTAHGAFAERLLHSEDFCADAFTDAAGARRRALLLCPCDRVRCITKCCPLGEAITCDQTDCDCRKYDGDWNPLHPDLPVPENDFPFEVVIDQNITCPHGYEPLVDAFAGYPFYMIETFWSKVYGERNVCGDVVVIWYASPRQGLMRCMRPFPFPRLAGLAHWLHVPEAALLAVSLAVLLLVPRRRVSVYSYVHDLAMGGHATSLLGRSLLWPAFIKRFLLKCSHIPIAIYFFSVAASFWLNVICINMVCGFWKPLGPQRGGAGAARRMFLWYSAYAWGAAFAMTALTTATWYAHHLPAGLIRPTLHETRTCFREDEAAGKVATFAYYYGPMGGLLVVNALLFSSTALRVRQLSRHSAVLGDKRSSGKAFRNERSLMVYVKLLWLMGVVETAMEIATWASNINEFYNAIVASCIDVLRAVAIFVMCCCKRRTVHALRERLCACAAARPLRRWRASRSQEVDLSEVGGRSSKDDTEVTVCDSHQCSAKDQ